MIEDLLKPGVRALTVACGLTLVVAALHTLGIAGDPPDARLAAVLEEMRGTTVGSGWFTFSLYAVFESVWIQVGVLLVMLAGKSLVAVAVVSPESRARVVRALSLFDALFYAGLTAGFVYYRIPPPLVSFAVLTVAFVVAAALARPAAIHPR